MRIFLVFFLSFARIIVASNLEMESRISGMEQEIRALVGKVENLESQVNSLRSNLNIPSVSDDFHSENSNNKISDDNNLAKAVSTGDKEKNDYDNALILLKDNKYDQAARLFSEFISKYPGSNMGSNAYFWYAECFYRQSNFEKAALNYLKGYKQYPKGTKAADSLLKLAFSLGEINKKQEACSTLEKLAKEFPQRPSSAIKRANEALDKFGCKKK